MSHFLSLFFLSLGNIYCSVSISVPPISFYRWLYNTYYLGSLYFTEKTTQLNSQLWKMSHCQVILYTINTLESNMLRTTVREPTVRDIQVRMFFRLTYNFYGLLIPMADIFYLVRNFRKNPLDILETKKKNKKWNFSSEINSYDRIRTQLILNIA